jgi:hypothetical protein
MALILGKATIASAQKASLAENVGGFTMQKLFPISQMVSEYFLAGAVIREGWADISCDGGNSDTLRGDRGVKSYPAG